LLVVAAAVGYTLRRRAAGKAARCCPTPPGADGPAAPGDHHLESVRHDHLEY